MYPDPSGNPVRKSSFISAEVLRGYVKPDGLLLGVVKAARPSWVRANTIIQVLTGPDEELILLVTSKAAGWLVGRVVLIDPISGSVTWVEDRSYLFKIVAPLRVPESYRHTTERALCPECPNVVRIENLLSHLERVHGITITQNG
jgi:hypothetical protein